MDTDLPEEKETVSGIQMGSLVLHRRGRASIVNEDRRNHAD